MCVSKSLLTDCKNSTSEQIQLRNELVEKNLRLAEKFAFRFAHHGVGVNVKDEDIIQIGYLGLIEAAQRFDPDAGFKFSSYAVKCIRNAICREIDNHEQTIRIPIYVHDWMRKSFTVRSEFFYETWQEPTLEEIAERMGISHKILQKAMSAVNDWQFFSIDDPEIFPELRDWLNFQQNQSWEMFLELEEKCSEVKYLLGKLEKFCERWPRSLAKIDIFKKRYGLTPENFLEIKTLQELGEFFGVTRERIRQICEWVFAQSQRFVYEENPFIEKIEAIKMLRDTLNVRDSELKRMIFGN